MPGTSNSRESSNTACSTATCLNIMAADLDDLKKPDFWRAVAAEFLGTMLLLLVGVGGCFTWHPHHAPSPTHLALHSGLCIAFLVMVFGHVSGGLVNPALSVAFAAAGKISLIRALFYIIAQCLGSIVGTALLSVIVPESIQGDFITLKLNKMTTEAQGFAVEFIISFVLLFGVFAAADDKRTDVGGSFALTLGLIVTINIFFGLNYTGGGMNPARQLGPSVFSGKWKHHWIYWIGPITGALTGALLYKYVFAVNASFKRAKKCLTRSGSYDSVAVEVKDDNFEEGDFYTNDDKKKLSTEVISSI